MSKTKSPKFQITKDHVDDLVLTHMRYRNSLNITGVQPAEHGRREHERQQAKKDQQALAPPGEPEPKPKDKGHCFKCKGHKEFEVDEERTTKTGAKQSHGKCPDCGTKLAGHFKPKGGD